MPQENGPALLYGLGQRHIVNECAAYRFKATNPLERFSADQDGAAGRCGHSRARIPDFLEGVKHLKKIYKRRHQCALGKGAAMEAYHLADESQAMMGKLRHQRG